MRRLHESKKGKLYWRGKPTPRPKNDMGWEELQTLIKPKEDPKWVLSKKER